MGPLNQQNVATKYSGFPSGGKKKTDNSLALLMIGDGQWLLI